LRYEKRLFPVQVQSIGHMACEKLQNTQKGTIPLFSCHRFSFIVNIRVEVKVEMKVTENPSS